MLYSNNPYISVPVDPHPCQHLEWSVFFHFSHSSGWALVSNCGFNVQFSNHYDVKHLLMCLFAIFFVFFSLFNTFAHFLLGCFLFY